MLAELQRRLRRPDRAPWSPRRRQPWTGVLALCTSLGFENVVSSYGLTLLTRFRTFAGYKASVFNLVYVSNTASLRIWDSLGFNRVGLVPEAGLLKSVTPGEPDVYTDAIVYHKTF